jgi:predicted metal-dependent hydrolase
MQYSIRYGDAQIGFGICFVPRLRRRVSIHVFPDGRVRVDAPEATALANVVDAVRRRAPWLWQQLETQRAQRHHVLPREYVSGESHFYLGRRYLLKVVCDELAEHGEIGVKRLRGRLVVTTRQPDALTVRRLLEAWYRQRAQEVFARRIDALCSNIAWLAKPPLFRLRQMRTQWGSCSPAGKLVLNPQLVKAPRNCVDYVITHELCHLKAHNHSPAYYRLLAAQMPDWVKHRQELDGLAEMLLNR